MNSKYLRLINWLPVLLLSGCMRSEYTKLATSELARGVRIDTVILGLKLGQSQKEFRNRCMNLNQERLVTQGPRGSVQYDFTDSLAHPKPTTLRVLLFAFFDESDKISDFSLEFSYPTWAPWNKEFQSELLEPKLIKLLMQWYEGNSFISVKVGEKKVPVKVDGNRRIMIKVKDSQSVIVMVQDLTHAKFKGNGQ